MPVDPGNAAVRYVNPTTGADVLPTLRAEIHRLVQAPRATPRHEVGSSAVQGLDGTGQVTVGENASTS